jgi:MFS family permease
MRTSAKPMSRAPEPAFDTSALAPFSSPAYRILWGVSLSATLATWMTDVAAGWLMIGMTTSPLMVALVQSASTLPTFLLGLPLGAIADMTDRRRYILASQLCIAAAALLAFAVLMTGQLNPPLLLALSFASGIGFAMRNPGIAGALPETVPRSQLPQALALNSVALNCSRVIGPGIAGLLIASTGTAAVYALNAVIALAGCIALTRWRRSPVVPHRPSRPILASISEGLRHVAATPAMRGVILRTAVFFGHSTILLALLPLVARQLDPDDPTAYALLFGALGAGAVFVCLVILPRLRNAVRPHRMVLAGSLIIAGSMLVLAFSPWLWLSTIGMFVAGIAWTGTGNTLTTRAQLGLPDGLRSRGMSIYMGGMLGANALGAALWGSLASVVGISAALAIAALSMGVIALLIHGRRDAEGGSDG